MLTAHLENKKNNFEMHLNDARNLVEEMVSEYSDSLGYSDEADEERAKLVEKFNMYFDEMNKVVNDFLKYYEVNE